MKDPHLSEAQAFGVTVRAWRQRLGFSQEALAVRVKLHRTYVGSVERGERNISLKNIHAFATALGTEASVLLSDSQLLLRESTHGSKSRSRRA